LTSIYGDQYLRYSLTTAQVLPDRQSVNSWKHFLAGFSISRISYREGARIVRFCAGAAAILLLHDVRAEGFGELIPLHPQDYDGLVLLGLIVLFSVAELMLLLRAKASLQQTLAARTDAQEPTSGEPVGKTRASAGRH
jgi:hypothetical protein